MQGDGGNASGWAVPETKGPPSPVLRVGLIAAGSWAVIGVVAAWLGAQIGSPTASGWLALLSGPLALFIAGRLNGLHGVGAWVRAGVIALVAVTVVGFAGIFVWTIVTYG
jgi:hypothetical protein